MLLGLGSYACAWAAGIPGFEETGKLDAIGLVYRARALSLKLVQIADNIPLDQAPENELLRLRDEANNAGITIELGTRGLKPEYIERYIGLCGRLKSRLLRVVTDTKDHQPSPDEIVERIAALLPKLTAAGVVLAIENHDRISSRTLAEIIERIANPAVGICLDTVNSFGSLEGPEHVVNTLGPYVMNLHLKDFTIAREPHMMGFRIAGAPAGGGRLNIPWLLERLQHFKRDVNAILELWPEPERDVASTIAKEEQWCFDSVRYLRTLIPD